MAFFFVECRNYIKSKKIDFFPAIDLFDTLLLLFAINFSKSSLKSRHPIRCKHYFISSFQKNVQFQKRLWVCNLFLFCQNSTHFLRPLRYLFQQPLPHLSILFPENIFLDTFSYLGLTHGNHELEFCCQEIGFFGQQGTVIGITKPPPLGALYYKVV